jgi:nucleotide-binding universal stress UspA family protein
MYEKVLVPIDGSETAEKAVAHAVGIAKCMKAQVLGLYVIDISVFSGIPTEAFWENIKELLDEEGGRALKVLADMAEKEGVPWETEIAEGVPAEDIIRIAEDKEIDLIVMGTAGRTGLDRFLLGSVAEKVIRTAPCPVMVVHK